TQRVRGRLFAGASLERDLDLHAEVPEECDDDIPLGREIAEERAARDACGLDDLVHRGLLEALASEQAQRGLRELGADQVTLALGEGRRGLHTPILAREGTQRHA